MSNPTGRALAAAGWFERQQEHRQMSEQAAALTEETLMGDLRDMILTHIRAMETPWSKLSEMQQRDKIDAATEAAKHAIRQAVQIVTAAGFPKLHVQTGKWTVKDGIKLEVTASASLDHINDLAEHGAGPAVLVLAEASKFMGSKTAAKPEPDQRPMFGEEEQAEQGWEDGEFEEVEPDRPALPAQDEQEAA